MENRGGVESHLTLYRWFTDISGLGITSQAMKLMQPEAPKKEEELAEALDIWLERVRRLEAHGDKYILPTLYKVAALRQLVVGKAKEHYELWEQDHKLDDDGGYQEILEKVEDYARKKRLDHNAQKNKSDMDVDQVDKNKQQHEAQLTRNWPRQHSTYWQELTQ